MVKPYLLSKDKPLSLIQEFEEKLAQYTQAPYAIMTDCCTHALELCLRYEQIKTTKFTAHTYISIAMLMHKLDIKYSYIDEQWDGEYNFYGTKIWDSARLFKPGMYRKGQMQCLSFGRSKPLDINGGGAILLDDEEAYNMILKQRYDGRDLTISPWEKQVSFNIGYHYRPTIEQAEDALFKLNYGIFEEGSQDARYPDLQKINIIAKSSKYD